jgi:hypothetical protein
MNCISTPVSNWIVCLEGKALTNITGNIAVQSGKHKITVRKLVRCAILDNQFAELLGHGHGLLPFHGILVFLSGGTRRGADFVQDQVWVVSEKQNESLAYRACGSEDTAFLFCDCGRHFDQSEPRDPIFFSNYSRLRSVSI